MLISPCGVGVIGDQAPGGAPASNEKVAYFETDWNANFSQLRVRSIAGTGGHRFPFTVPPDYNETIEVYLEGLANATFTDQDIDLASEYAAIGENFQTHAEIDNTSVFSMTGQQWNKLDLSSVLTALSAGDIGGVFVDHNGIGTTVYYGRLVLRYK